MRYRRLLLVLLGVLALLGVALLIGLPIYVRGRVIAVAAEQGVALDVGSVRLVPGSLTIHDLSATAAEVPGVRVIGTEVEVELVRLEPRVVTLRGFTLQIDGNASTVVTSVDRWRTAHAPPAGSAQGKGGKPIPAVILQSGAVSWTRPGGESSRIEATGLTGLLQLDKRGRAEDKYHLGIGRAFIDAGGTRFGPWGLSLERSVRFTSVVCTLDPGGAKKAIVHLGTEGTDTIVDVDVARAKLSMLGVPASSVGLGGQDPEASAQIHVRHGPQKGAGTFSAALFGARFGGVSASTDVRVAGEAVLTDPQRGFDLQKGTFGFGPFSGTVTGTLGLAGGRPSKVDLAYKSNPVGCADLLKGAATQSLGDLGTQLGALAQAAGLTRAVAGEASVSGVVAYDMLGSSPPSFTMVPVSSCGVSFFSR